MTNAFKLCFFNGGVNLRPYIEGHSYCNDPANATIPRYDMALFIDSLIIKDGALTLSDVVVGAVGYGAYKAPLRDMLWEVSVSGTIATAMAGSAYSVMAEGRA